MGFYQNLTPIAQSTIFVYDMGSSFGSNGVGNSISILNFSGTFRLQSYTTMNSIGPANNPIYGGSTDASQGQFNAPAFYSMVKNDKDRIFYYVNGNLHSTYSMASVTPNMATASCPGNMLITTKNISTTSTVVTKDNSSRRQFAFVFIGSKSIDQSILYNNVNAYLTSIDAAIINS